MGKPRLIIIIRHGQSEGNKNRDIHQTVPDHRVKLTGEGWQQAYDAGRRLRSMLRADDTVQFFTSPYRRTRETTQGILETLTSDSPEPSPFQRGNIKVYEEPRLREQDFGNFQPCSAEMERMWQERADYGHFFYRIPNGESAADAYDRVSGFNESLWRQFGEEDFPSVCVLVTHGLMSRVFLMKWYHFSVEYFEDLRNINHCEFLIMRKQADGGKYKLETKLRTWSELRRERAALLRQKEEEAAREATAQNHSHNLRATEAKDKDSPKLEKAASLFSAASLSSTTPPLRRWGGCPNGCNHDQDFKIRPGIADLIKHDGTNVNNSRSNSRGSNRNSNSNVNGNVKTANTSGHASPRRTAAVRRFHSAAYSDDDDGGDAIDDNHTPPSPVSLEGKAGTSSRNNESGSTNGKGAKVDSNGGLVLSGIDVKRAREEIVSSPDATPSFITRPLLVGPSPPPKPRSFMHIGRDFGGTYSGHTSDADSSEDERVRQRMARLKLHIASSNSSKSSGSHHFYGTLDTVAAEGGGGDDVDDGVDGKATGHDSDTPDPALAGTGCSHTNSKAGAGSTGGETTGAAGITTKAIFTSKSASMARTLSGNIRRKRTKNMANRLGDVPQYSDCEQCSDCERCSDCEHNDTDVGGGIEADRLDAEDDVDDELAEAQNQDRSIRGSVY